MYNKQQNEYQFNAIGLIKFLWDKKVPIIVLTGIAAIASIIVSLLIEDKYKSEVIVFPTASGSVSQDLLSSSYSNKSLLRLGEDEEIDQLLQVLNSDEIRDRIIEEFDLQNHYEIKDDEKFKHTKLYKTYNDNITFKPTKFLSVRIEVLDKDPQTAADIANKITDLIDTVMIGMQREKALEAYYLVEEEYTKTKEAVAALEDSLNVIRSYGVIDYYTQIERFSEALGKAIVENNKPAVKILENKLDILAKYGGPFLEMRENLGVLRMQVRNLQGKYAEAKVDAFQALPQKYVVNKAVVAEKKSYPVRSVIVILSSLAAFVLTVLFLLIADVVKKYQKEIKS